jgi:hypothetical protein
MEALTQILRDFGAWALLLVVILYIILKGEIVFRYPRPKRKG